MKTHNLPNAVVTGSKELKELNALSQKQHELHAKSKLIDFMWLLDAISRNVWADTLNLIAIEHDSIITRRWHILGFEHES